MKNIKTILIGLFFISTILAWCWLVGFCINNIFHLSMGIDNNCISGLATTVSIIGSLFFLYFTGYLCQDIYSDIKNK
jgi:hypothetical protein